MRNTERTTRKRSKRGSETKSARMDIRVSGDQKQALLKEAQALGLNLSELILLRCLDPSRGDLEDILRKARPADRADPRMVTGLARSNLLLAQLRDRLANTDPINTISHKAVLLVLLSIARQLDQMK